MRRLFPWGLAAVMLSACQTPQPAAPPTPPATQPQVPANQLPSHPAQSVLAPILFLTGPTALEANQTATLTGRVMLPQGSTLEGLDIQSLTPSPSPTPRHSFGSYGGAQTFTYSLKMAARVVDPHAREVPVDFSLPFTPAAAGTYHLQLDPRSFTVSVNSARRTSSWGRGAPSPSPSPLPEMWGLLGPAEFPADEPVLGNPNLVTRTLTTVEAPASARIGQPVAMTARFWTSGLGKEAVDAYVDGDRIKVTGLSMPDPRKVMGPIPRQVEVTFSVTLPERRVYTVVSGNGEGAYATINAY